MGLRLLDILDLKDEDRRWRVIGAELQEIKKLFGPATPLGKRRTEVGEAPADLQVPIEAVIEREPVTVLLSAKGWIRALRGHLDISDAKHKEGDKARFAIKAETTDKLLLFATNGRFYTLGVDKLPGGRGFGEPVRLLVEFPNDQDIVTLLIHGGGRRFLVASRDGRGFLVPEDEVLAQTKNGKQVLNLGEGGAAAICVPAEGDSVAVVGENRKLLIFSLSELPEMTRGRGVLLQKYREGGLSDLKTFTLKQGLTWSMGAGRVRTETELRDWIGKRSQAGRLPPRGFPKSNRFGETNGG